MVAANNVRLLLGRHDVLHRRTTWRGFITLLGGAAAWLIAARAQQSSMPVIGYLSHRSPIDSANIVTAFRLGPPSNQITRQRRQAINLPFREAKFDGHILALDDALLFQSLDIWQIASCR
jgi:hypothetical protein